MSDRLRSELQAIYNDLHDRTNDWSISIGHIIPRDPHVESFGDASLVGGGAHCPSLQIWFYTLWGDRIQRATRLKPTDPEYVHINCLEFVVVILQVAAVITAFDTLAPDVLRALLKSGRLPAEPILLAWCDNTSAEKWTTAVHAKSLKGQNLVRIYAEILRSTNLGINCEHISSTDNHGADCISRPSSLSSHTRTTLQTDIPESRLHTILELFPPESRALTAPLLGALQRTMAGPTKPPKELRTNRSRRIHYLQFAHTMRWTDDLLMETMPIERRNLQLALYAAHLGAGCTLWCRQIKVATIKQYINAVASFMALFGTHPRDPRKRNPTDSQLAPEITAVYTELGRWEQVPNRREPFTLDMLRHQQDCARQANPLSLLAAIADWSECGLFTGHRLTEWAQPQGHQTLADPHLDIFGNPRAFRLNDLTFARQGRVHMTLSAALASPDDVYSISVCWRTQKNGENGEKKIFTRNPRKDGHSLVQPMMRIVQRFVKLRGANDSYTPLAIFQDDSGTTRYITAVEIESTMRATAAAVYQLDPQKHKKELQLWSAHSYRVGACVILHAMGYTGAQIKFLLRWKSETFLMYLRNLTILADQHHRTLDKAAAMPHFV